jgi:hypothetical protein
VLRQPQPLVAGSSRGLTAQGALAQALSGVPSGREAQVQGGKLLVSLSFKAADGRLCRQFRLGAEAGGAEAVACRSGEAWRIEGWAPAAARADGYQAAAGPDETPVAAIVDRLGVEETLDAAAEAHAITGGWKAPEPRASR